MKLFRVFKPYELGNYKFHNAQTDAVSTFDNGVFGAVYVTASIAAVPRLGAATLIALVITGQMLTSLVLDHFGAFGLQEHGLTIWRAVGALLLIVGVVLIRTA